MPTIDQSRRGGADIGRSSVGRATTGASTSLVRRSAVWWKRAASLAGITRAAQARVAPRSTPHRKQKTRPSKRDGPDDRTRGTTLVLARRRALHSGRQHALPCNGGFRAGLLTAKECRVRPTG